MEDSESGSSEAASKLDHIEDVNNYSQVALKSVLAATKYSNDLPTGDGYDFYSTFRQVKDVLNIEGQRVLSLIDSILNQQCLKGRISRDSVEIEDKFDVLTDANDYILERVGNNLDEASGIKRTETNLLVKSVEPRRQIATSWNKKKGPVNSPTSFRLLAAKNTIRPQFKFKDKVDNSSNPFIPRIKSKPNAIVSLEESLKIDSPSGSTSIESYPHPYQTELEKFQPLEEFLDCTEPESPPGLDETPLTYVETEEELDKVLTKLKSAKEIAIDLEAHSYRSYQGITCLMQLSTRKDDFIIDTLALRSELHVLNDVFTDPNIVKVLHGADFDILWLQRDLGLYVVNMFDTGQAARVLNFPRFSLAHLLDVYCEVEADKQYQLADWRIRPLPEELIRYARSDTHYLLYIYDRLRKELVDNGNDQKNLLNSVLDRSRQLCMKVYKKPTVGEDSYLELYRKSRSIFNSQQLTALKQLHAWRDKVARVEDESTGYVLPNHMLLQISSVLPREKQGILACCNPIPPIVRQYLNEIHAFIEDARSLPVARKQKVNTDVKQSEEKTTEASQASIFSRHDNSESERDHGIPVLDQGLVSDRLLASVSSLLASKPIVSAFGSENTTKAAPSGVKRAREIAEGIVSPVDMYLPGVPCKSVVRWKLKPNTIVEKKEEEEGPVYVPPGKRKRGSEKEPVPLRRTVHQEKKMKVDKSEREEREERETKVELSEREKIKDKSERVEKKVKEDKSKREEKEKKIKDKSDREEEKVQQSEREEDRMIEDSPKSDKVEKKKKKDRFKHDNFKPFDYGSVDKGMFGHPRRGGRERGRGGRGRGRGRGGRGRRK